MNLESFQAMMQRRYLKYLFAVSVSILAAFIRWLLAIAFGPIPPYNAFYVPVIVSTLFGGTATGIFATFLCAVMGAIFFVTPAFRIGHPHDLAGFAMFLLNGILLSIIADMLRRSRVAAAANRISEERFRAMADGSPLMICVTDANACLEFVNAAYLDFFGITITDIQTLGWRPLIHPDDSDVYISRFMESVKSRSAFHGEARVRRKDGEWRVIETISRPRFAPSGSFIGMVGTNTDITDRKRAEEMVRRDNVVLDGINRILNAALTSATEEGLGRICLAVAEDVTQSRFGFIAEIGPDGHLYHIAMSDPGWQLCAMKKETGHSRPTQAFKLRGFFGRVLIDGKAFFTNYPASHPDSIGLPHGHPSITAFLGAPLKFQGKTIGMIAVANREGGYSSQDVDTLMILSVAMVQALMRKRADEALNEAHAQLEARVQERTETVLEQSRILESFFRHTPTSIVFLDREFNFIRVNEAYARTCGRDVSDFSGRNHFLDYPSEELKEKFQRVIDTAEPYTVMGRPFIFPDHPERGVTYWDLSVAPILGHDGKVDFLILSLLDVTIRKQSEEELRRYQEKLEDLVQERTNALRRSLHRFELLTETASRLLRSTGQLTLVDSICAKVMEHLDCHVFFNFLVDDQAGKLRLNAYSGIPEEEARRIEWLEFGAAFCGSAARDSSCIISERIQTTTDERTELVKSFGVKAYCCHPLLSTGGKIIGTLSFGTKNRETFTHEELSLMKAVTDQVAVAITRMNDEQTLQKRTRELEISNKELEAFAYSVSHDLRSPLRSIAGFSEILKKDYSATLDEKGKKYLDRVHKNAAKMNDTIYHLLHLSRISRQELIRQEVDLTAMARSLMASLHEEDKPRRVTVDIKEGITAFVDTGLIEVALSNLLANAWKFTSEKENARIEFGLGMREGKQTYYVRDNGAGFDQTYANRLFQPFHRLHTDQQFEGTGIGLAITERAIRRHGGEIWAEGNINEGAAFFFTL